MSEWVPLLPFCQTLQNSLLTLQWEIRRLNLGNHSCKSWPEGREKGTWMTGSRVSADTHITKCFKRKKSFHAPDSPPGTKMFLLNGHHPLASLTQTHAASFLRACTWCLIPDGMITKKDSIHFPSTRQTAMRQSDLDDHMDWDKNETLMLTFC